MLGFHSECIEIDITISTPKILINVLNWKNVLSPIAHVQYEVSHFRNLRNQIQRHDSYKQMHSHYMALLLQCFSLFTFELRSKRSINPNALPLVEPQLVNQLGFFMDKLEAAATTTALVAWS